MNQRSSRRRSQIGVALVVAGMSAGGCTPLALSPAQPIDEPGPRVAPLGTISDGVWSQQEVEAEASKFVMHEHEFQLRSHRLNTAGEDHVKQIASRIHEGAPFPVVVERSMNDTSLKAFFDGPAEAASVAQRLDTPDP